MLDPTTGNSVNITAFGLVNDSTHVTADQAEQIAAACQAQLAEDVCPAWNLSPVPTITVYASLDAVPVDKGIFVMRLVDETDQPGSLGYHNAFYAEVECASIVSNGGGVLAGTGVDDTVSSVTSHEFIETMVDPDVNLWVPTATTDISEAFEAADPVQGNFYMKSGVQVSNFVFPQWFILNLPAGAQYDFMKLLSQPFQIAPGGYVVQEGPDGATTDVFGDKPPPAWRMAIAQRRKQRHLIPVRRRVYRNIGSLNPPQPVPEATHGN